MFLDWSPTPYKLHRCQATMDASKVTTSFRFTIFSFKDAIITSTGRVIIGPLIGFGVIYLFSPVNLPQVLLRGGRYTWYHSYLMFSGPKLNQIRKIFRNNIR